MNKHDILQILTITIILTSITSEAIVAQSNNKTPTHNNPSQNYSIYSRQDTTPHHRHPSKIELYPNQNMTIMNGGNDETTNRDTENSLMNSTWPMYCHDLHHTSQSPYNTSQNPPQTMQWIFTNDNLNCPYGSQVIDNQGTIYLADASLFAIYPNGTLKWQYRINGGWSQTTPIIDTNGTIYTASAYKSPNYIYAVNPDGTTKWLYPIYGEIHSSFAMGTDGTLYFGCGSSIIALNTNGTLRWNYPTGSYVYSSPAIGDDGTIYCGSIDTYLYALYPNNGTLKWRFKTGDWIRVSPCIDTEGTIYCVSMDGYLYSLRPNGTMKWRTDVGAGNDPTIGPDGTIYAGWDHLYAINPTEGSVKWVIDAGGQIEGGTPCISHDGIIYYGTWNSGNIYAISPNGTKLWQAHVGDCEAALSIGSNGTVYISANDGLFHGYLYAFGRGPLRAEANGPYDNYRHHPITFQATPFGGTPPYTYLWHFGDARTSTQQSPTHRYFFPGTYHATLTITDSTGNTSTDNTTVTVYYPPPWIIVLKPRRAIYENNRYIFPYFHPVIYGPITIRAIVIEPAFFGIVRIDHVVFCIRGDIVQTFTHPPYQWTWTPIYNDINSEIEIYAYDTAGHYSLKTIQVETHV